MREANYARWRVRLRRGHRRANPAEIARAQEGAATVVALFTDQNVRAAFYVLAHTEYPVPVFSYLLEEIKKAFLTTHVNAYPETRTGYWHLCVEQVPDDPSRECEA